MQGRHCHRAWRLRRLLLLLLLGLRLRVGWRLAPLQQLLQQRGELLLAPWRCPLLLLHRLLRLPQQVKGRAGLRSRSSGRLKSGAQDMQHSSQVILRQLRRGLASQVCGQLLLLLLLLLLQAHWLRARQLYALPCRQQRLNRGLLLGQLWQQPRRHARQARRGPPGRSLLLDWCCQRLLRC